MVKRLADVTRNRRDLHMEGLLQNGWILASKMVAVM